MKSSPAIGEQFRFQFKVGVEKTVPNLYPESAIFTAMPQVLATGFMVGLMEWACAEHLASHLDEGEGSLGILVNVTHTAPTLPGQVVVVEVVCDLADKRRIGWTITARDEVDIIGQGRHERAVVAWDRFAERLAAKRDRLGPG